MYHNCVAFVLRRSYPTFSFLEQPLFQVPLNIGGQQVFIQQSADSLQEQGVEVHEG